MAKPTIVTRATKGSALTWTEGDANITNLRDATFTIEAGTAGTDVVSDLNGIITLVAGTNISLSGDNTAKTVTITNTQSAGATTLDGLSDVVLGTPATDELLQYNGTNWVDVAASSVTVGNVSGTVAIANGGTGKTSAPSANAALNGFTTTATAAGTTTLTNTSSVYQLFTGTTTQTVVLPSTATLATGWSFHIVNNSTGLLTIQTSTAVSLGTIPAGVTVMVTCISTAVNTAAAWEMGYTDFSTVTGTGAVVLGTSPTLTTPALGTPSAIVLTNASGTASININGTVGATTANTGAFTTLSASTSVSFSPSGAITLNPTTAGTINNMSIGATTASTGRFTTVTSTIATGTAPFTVTSTTKVVNLNVELVDGYHADEANTASTIAVRSAGGIVTATGFTGTIGQTTPASGVFTTLSAATTTLDDIRETVFAYGNSGVLTWTPDAANGSVQTITLTGNLTLSAFANPVSGQSITFIITQDATGSRTLTSTMKFAGGSKTLSTAANAIDILTVSYIGTTYYASLAKGFA